MLVKVHLKNIKIDTLIGAHAIEQEVPQPLVVDLSFEMDAKKAIQSDQIADTTNYTEVAHYTLKLIRQSSFQLLESLAHFLATKLISNFKFHSVHLRIHKPMATKGLADVSVEYSMSA